jgi:hypothetical protein
VLSGVLSTPEGTVKPTVFVFPVSYILNPVTPQSEFSLQDPSYNKCDILISDMVSELGGVTREGPQS